MPSTDPAARTAYQRAYYRRHQRPLKRRARLRQRLTRGTQTLWHILPEPQGFCAAMAQKAINEGGGVLPPTMTKEDLQQDIAEALVQGKAASQCRNPLQYAATLAIRVAKRRIRQEEQYGLPTENERVAWQSHRGDGRRPAGQY